MLRDIFLHGAPGRRFGRRWRIDISSPVEAIRALCALRPELREIFRAGRWRIIVGPPHIRHGIAAEHLMMNMGSQPLHIVPAQQPSGGDDTLANVGKIVVGVVLMASVIFLGPGLLGATLFSLGLSMTMAGVSGLLTPKPRMEVDQATQSARAEDRPSFLFNGVTNNTQQGGPVPVVMGLHLVGSIVIGGSINTESIG